MQNMANTVPSTEAKDKLLQVFRFAHALNQLRNPVQKNIDDYSWTFWLHQLPEHDSVRRGTVNQNEETDEFIFKIKRAEKTLPPKVPKELEPWISRTYMDPFQELQLNKSITIKNELDETITVSFEEERERIMKFKAWKTKYDEWQLKEKPARRSIEIFERLYNLYARLERENEQLELILGDGILYWLKTEGNTIKHPMLLQRVQVHFDPPIPEFTLTYTDHPKELYTAALRILDEVSPKVINQLQEEINNNNYHPLEEKETTEFLKSMVNQLASNGEFTGQEVPSGKRDRPQIGRDPVIFLRKRNMGMTATIEQIIEDLTEREDNLPSFLKNIVGLEERITTANEATARITLDPNGEDEQILLCKEANAEQLQIARQLESSGAVMVQGPPGTGKTHTIANLLGHLLAQGKNVLVTSHTSKALKVLREKVVEPLQPLCVSVLADDNRQQLGSAIDAITEKLSNSIPEQLDEEAEKLLAERKKVLAKLRDKREQLKSACYDEYRSIVVAGETYEPSKAARILHEGIGKHDWIPSPVTLGAPLPLAEKELKELYQLNHSISTDDKKDLILPLPNPSTLLTELEFQELVQKRKELLEQNLKHRKDLWDHSKERKYEELQELMNQLQQVLSFINQRESWKLNIIEAGKKGPLYCQPWINLLDQIKNTYEEAAKAQEKIFEYGPLIPPKLLHEETEVVLQGLLEAIKQKGKITRFDLLFKGEWKKILATVKVNGKEPSQPQHFEALLAYLKVMTARKKLIDRWERQAVTIGAPTVQEQQEPEQILYQFYQPIQNCLDWYQDKWLKMEHTLQRQGFNWDVLINESDLSFSEYQDLLKIQNAVEKKLPAIMQAEQHRIQLKEITNQINEQSKKLEKEGYSHQGIGKELYSALINSNTAEYQKAYQRLIELKTILKDYNRKNVLLQQLNNSAPAWASALMTKKEPHNQASTPGPAKEAWIWRQLRDELDRRHNISVEELQQEIEGLRKTLIEMTASLVEKKAWSAQVRRTTLKQRQALQGWKQIMRRVGKGTGIRAPQLLAEARQLMPICQTAVPVWIMPLNRMTEAFSPKENRFDVVIIDEASQSDIMALVALYLGKQIVIVGDDQQVSPMAVGERQGEVQKLIDTYLAAHNIPNAKLYDGMFSIYDLAKTTYQPVCLREHFRCVAPIIQYSNDLSYEGKIKALRDDSTTRIKPPTVAYRVEKAEINRRVNVEEAKAVASLLIACTEQQEYAKASFGVISLSGDQQAGYIDSLLQKHLSTQDYIERKIQCGNPAHFQGDERDVIFLSLVDGPDEKGGPLRRKTEGNQDLFKKRYNVAASRARDQLWVVHSLDPSNDLKEGDLRLGLIRHAEDPFSKINELKQKSKKAESEFEREVLKRLIHKGYKVTPQWHVGAYRIDMVVEGNGNRLAIECDGDKYHTLDNLEDDMNRQAILERLGWRFARIRGSQFYSDPDHRMERLYKKLSNLEIYPSFEKGQLEIDFTHDAAKEKVIIRAAEIRREWESQEEKQGWVS
ncbi:AAA domain-containing protein [Heliorestis convoluta]|uniref:Helicase N-terminal domain, putative n=1 Tax=Heliorestis convoluta TaxID=356322 RepID=A0A5Q2N115_9FIRM|nr:AAA domain-containing protein [Heliorestis convoluta]QGG48031.1 helicase N-terminal domain, putative [Heliorestis convoluta]